jgi:hypothetical protein
VFMTARERALNRQLLGAAKRVLGRLSREA